MILLLATGAPPAVAQDVQPPDLFVVELQADRAGLTHVPLGAVVVVPLTVRDLSKDGPGGLVPDGPASGGPFTHIVDFVMTPVSPDNLGWVALPIPSLLTRAGDERHVDLRVTVVPTAANPSFLVNVTALLRDARTGSQAESSISLMFFSPGIPGFTMRSGGALDDLRPRELRHADLVVENVGLLPRTIRIEVINNPCDLRIAGVSSTTLEPREQRVIPLTVQGPEGRLWYNYQDCSFTVQAMPVDADSARVSASVAVVVTGYHVDPAWVFWIVASSLVILLLLLFIRTRKARIEEEILGKPQRPWTIPAEVVYLDALKERDPRAWYVVRHYLMEDEYRSALLWYKHEKRATRGTRKKERLIVQTEHKLARREKRWQRRIARPPAKADRHAARLQRRLDRRAARRYRKAMRHHDATVRRLDAAHEKRVERAHEQWRKAAQRAERRGQPAPAKPQAPRQEYPQEPVLGEVALTDHRWARREARYRRRMERKQARLEHRRERVMARALRRARRRAQRIARKLDDPEFLASHPLLAGSDAA